MTEPEEQSVPTNLGGKRLAVLLGAGASHEAGIPLTSELASELVRQTNKSPPYPRNLQRALNYVYGALVYHTGKQGDNPLGSVNVERLISALRLLQTRNTHEAAPFVSAWEHGVEAFDEHPAAVSSFETVAGAISSSLNGRGSESEIDEAVGAVARAAVAPGNGRTYLKLEAHLLKLLGPILEPSKSVMYLTPVVQLANTQPGGVDVATLNYDTTIERCAEELGIEVDIGVDRWSPGHVLDLPPAENKLRLYKLHGSVNWRSDPISQPHNSSDKYLPTTRIIVDIGNKPFEDPAIVIGDRGKLENSGPTLSLLAAFESALEKADHLVVCGYSFADDHVNDLIRNWINADLSRTLTTLDPKWEQSDPIGFSEELIRNLVRRNPRDSGATPPRFGVVRQKMSVGIQRALTMGPSADPSPRFVSETVSGDPDEVVLCITNVGARLERVVLRHQHGQRKKGEKLGRVKEIALGSDPTEWDNQLWVPEFDTKQSILLHLRYNNGTPRETGLVSISGYDEVGWYQGSAFVLND